MMGMELKAGFKEKGSVGGCHIRRSLDDLAEIWWIYFGVGNYGFNGAPSAQSETGWLAGFAGATTV